MAKAKDGRGRLYWMKRHTIEWLQDFAYDHKILLSFLAVLTLGAMFLARAMYHSYVMIAREHVFVVVLVVIAYTLLKFTFGDYVETWEKVKVLLPIGLVFAVSISEAVGARISIIVVIAEHLFLLAIIWAIAYYLQKFRDVNWKGRLGLTVVLMLVVYGIVQMQPHQYLSLYYRYKTLDVLELAEDPTTKHDRSRAIAEIHALGKAKMGDVEFLAEPDFVREVDGYYFTMAISHRYKFGRLVGHVRQLFNVLGTVTAPDFSSREKVNFDVAENLLLSSNSLAATCKTYNPWRYINYQPVEVRYVKDDTGEWVQVVSMLRWRGIIFPYPEFGGVQIIKQVKTHDEAEDDAKLTKKEAGDLEAFTKIAKWSVRNIKKIALGKGEWIAPKDISKHAYLKGQNIYPYVVSRYIANSFRYQKGFFAPMPGWHAGDIRIPYLPDDRNEQPFTIFFDMGNNKIRSDLYHYFSMEPYSKDKKGLNTSIFILADGTQNEVCVINHADRGDGLTGVSGIVDTIAASRMNLGWKVSVTPIESRPYWKKVWADKGSDRVTKFWLTSVTIASDKEDGSEGTGDASTQKRESVAATREAELVLVDSDTLTVIWVGSSPQEEWMDQIRKKMPYKPKA